MLLRYTQPAIRSNVSLPQQSFVCILFSLVRLVCSNSEHLFDHRGILYSNFHKYNIRHLFNRGSTWIDANWCCSSRFDQPFGHVLFASAVILTCSVFIILTHLFNYRGIFLLKIFGETLNCLTLEVFDNHNSIV